MRKMFLLAIGLMGLFVVVVAQPTVLQSSLFATATNTTPNSTNVRLNLTAPSASFKQVRFLDNVVPGGTNTWAFHIGAAGDAVPDYSTCWRPYDLPGQSGPISLNNYIQPLANINSARCNTTAGGFDGNLPAITAGRYYTFNVTNNSGACGACSAAPSSGGSCNSMQILETIFNPVTILTVTATTPANINNSVLVTATTSAAPAAGENVYLRYSTNVNFLTSTLSQFSFSGTTGTALIPCFAGGTQVYYYVYSSNKSMATINTDVLTYGEFVHDMSTLNLRNNSNANYTYTQGVGVATNFIGIYHVPSTCYATMGAFVTALNGGAVTGPVTCYAVGGSPTETTAAGGISITQTGTVANPIVFQKFGTGNYTLQAPNPQTGGGALNDAIIKLVGADYITIDGFTLQENPLNTTTTAGTNNMTEWGIALLYASATNGSQNNTLQNNTISLSRLYQNSFGIYSNVRHTATSVSAIADNTNATGSNSGNKVYTNAISNVNYGIVFIGCGSSTTGLMDNGNDIGGSSLATGNTITNSGGIGVAPSTYISLTGNNYLIFDNNQYNDNISYNSITSALGTTSGTILLGGILKNYSGGTTVQPVGTITTTINNNTVTITNNPIAAATGGVVGITNQGLNPILATATMSMNNNTVQNCVLGGANATTNGLSSFFNTSRPGTMNMNGNNIINNAITAASSTTGILLGMSNSGPGGTVNMNSNVIRNMSSTAASGQMQGIINSGAVVTALNMNNNQLGNASGGFFSSSVASIGTLFGILSSAGASTCAQTMTGNDIRGITYSVAASAAQQYITGQAAGIASINISNNTFNNLSINSSGNIIFIVRSGAMTATGTSTCNNNSIVTAFNKLLSGGQVAFFTSGSFSVNGSTMTETGNNFSNVTITGTTTLFGWDNEEGNTSSDGPVKTITGNTFNNITTGSGQVQMMTLDWGNATNCSSNTITNVTGTGNIFPIAILGNNGQGTHNYSLNSISNISSTGAGGNVVGILGGATSIPTTNISTNTITGLSSTGASVVVSGIELDLGTTVNINDNIINALSCSGTTSPFVNGIITFGGTTVNVFKNKIHTLSQSGIISTTAGAVNGLLFTAGNTVTAYNNFIANLNAPLANINDVIRCISITSTTASTTYNLYYNSVYLNATSVGANFGTSGIYHTTNATATTAALNMIDNIIVNTSTAIGTGVTAAYRRSNATLTNFAATSNYNLFYAGTPGPANLIYYDGTNADQTLAAYKARVSTRDANSISVLPNFTSTTDLHLTSTDNCEIDGYGTPIATYTTDIDAQLRNVTTPDMGADEFTGPIGTLAGVIGGHPTQVCVNKTVVSTGTNYLTPVCDLVARIVPSGGTPVTGVINTCVTIEPISPFPNFNLEPFVQRYYDIEPVTSPSTSTATITLYFKDQEFVDFNANNASWPDLPTVVSGGNADPNIVNLRVTQYHGSAFAPWGPGNYTGVGGAPILLNPGMTPGISSVFYNAAALRWEVTVKVVGFSGFYVHSNVSYPLPISVNYFRGSRQGSTHLLNWKITCNTTPRATMTLERSGSASGPFTSINTITADALRCSQPFDYTDVQPLKGMNYYRLKMTDADGKITYSGIVALLNAVKGFEIINVVPNPVTSTGLFKLNIASAQVTKMNLVITDMQGRIVMRQANNLVDGFNTIDMNVAGLASGTYNISGITAEEKTRVIRFVKQ